MENLLKNQFFSDFLSLLQKGNIFISIYKNDTLLFSNKKDIKVFTTTILNKGEYKIVIYKDTYKELYYKAKAIYDSETYFFSKYGILEKLKHIVEYNTDITTILYEFDDDSLVHIVKILNSIMDLNTYISRIEKNKYLIVFSNQKDENINKKIEYINNNISNYHGIYKIDTNSFIMNDCNLIAKYLISKTEESLEKVKIKKNGR